MGAVLIVPALLLAVFSYAQETKTVETAGNSPKFKNIKVLKDLPATELIPEMHRYNEALGVTCDYCHAITTNATGERTGFELDDKKKKTTARAMVEMCDDIKMNQKSLKGKVSCFMCHHGSHKPAMAAQGSAAQATPLPAAK